MKLIAINVKVPDSTDKYLRCKARERLVSKAAVVRDILRAHVESVKQVEKLSQHGAV